jgi:hypothetical protein
MQELKVTIFGCFALQPRSCPKKVIVIRLFINGVQDREDKSIDFKKPPHGCASITNLITKVVEVHNLFECIGFSLLLYSASFCSNNQDLCEFGPCYLSCKS